MDWFLTLLDFFGVPAFGGNLTLACDWKVTQPLAEAASPDPIALSSRVKDLGGNLLVADGPRAPAVPARPVEITTYLPLVIPDRPGAYRVLIEPVVEHRFWASAVGMAPAEFNVERYTNGDIAGEDPRTGRTFTVACPRSEGKKVFRIEHRSYGIFDSERAVEIPWVLSRYEGQRRVLDIGYSGSEPRHRRAVKALDVPFFIGFDLIAANEPDVLQVAGDARTPPFRPGCLDQIWAISVVEHFGRDNSAYTGAPGDHDPDGDLVAVQELGRLLSPAGTMLITVPFGAAEDHGWFIQYDNTRLGALIDASGLKLKEAEYYAYKAGWKGPVDPFELAEVRYRGESAAASGLACLSLQSA